MKHKFISSIFLFTLFVAGCGTKFNSIVETIKGSGNVVSVERDVGRFSRIQINLGADLALTQGDGHNITIDADDNLMSYLTTEIVDSQLIVSTREGINFSTSHRIHLAVTFSTLTGIDIRGSSNITGKDLKLDDLSVSFSGSGSTHLKGTAGKQTISIRGQATINNFDLISQDAAVDISGSGVIEINAKNSLNVTVGGLGIIQYMGSPLISQNISGTAKITQKL